MGAGPGYNPIAIDGVTMYDLTRRATNILRRIASPSPDHTPPENDEVMTTLVKTPSGGSGSPRGPLAALASREAGVSPYSMSSCRYTTNRLRSPIRYGGCTATSKKISPCRCASPSPTMPASTTLHASPPSWLPNSTVCVWCDWRRGRGCALQAVWSTSNAPVLAYMDVDLSTDLAALAPGWWHR